MSVLLGAMIGSLVGKNLRVLFLQLPQVGYWPTSTDAKYRMQSVVGYVYLVF
jgi:hypothetical protein